VYHDVGKVEALAEAVAGRGSLGRRDAQSLRQNTCAAPQYQTNETDDPEPLYLSLSLSVCLSICEVSVLLVSRGRTGEVGEAGAVPNEEAVAEVLLRVEPSRLALARHLEQLQQLQLTELNISAKYFFFFFFREIQGTLSRPGSWLFWTNLRMSLYSSLFFSTGSRWQRSFA
jgi:hypothetical protein